MGKKLMPGSNFRVVVEPRRLGDFGSVSVSDSFLYGSDEAAQERMARAYRERCEEIEDAIKRHVDNVGDVRIEFEREVVCEHCGWPWTVGASTYNGGCCEKDQEAEDARLAAIAGAQP